jgi:hypothetical protein
MSEHPDEPLAITPMAQPFSVDELREYEHWFAAFEWN